MKLINANLTNANIFTGEDWIAHGTISIKEGLVHSIHPDKVALDETTIDVMGGMLVPAFLDLQIYGAAGKLFAAYPTMESLALLAGENRKHGVAGCLATIATQPHEVMYDSITAIQDYWKNGGEGILGMHLEGPYINAEKRGAHIETCIHPPTVTEVKELLAFAHGAIKMVTLAPECCDPAIITLFKEAGLIVAAGHSNASYQQALQFSSLGITTVTHLFNAMSPLHHRDTGIPGAAFEDKQLTASIIPDGIHVSYAALRIAKQQMQERLFFITDAVTATNMGAYQHKLHEDRYCMPDGTLSGSAISMLQGVKNAVQHAGIPLEEALRMAALYPAKIMGMADAYGTIEVGRPANMLLLNKDLDLVDALF